MPFYKKSTSAAIAIFDNIRYNKIERLLAKVIYQKT